jgi:hypothetical protein
MAAIHNQAGTNFLAIDASGNAPVTLPSNQVVNLPTTQQIVNRDQFSDIPRGLVAGAVTKSMQGYNGSVGTVFEPLIVNSAAAYPIVNTAITLTLSSASANDTAAGTGARTVLVEGVGANFVLQSEVVTLNGQTGVNTVSTYLAVNAITVLSAGTGLVNAGAIYAGFGTITTGVPASVLSAVAVGENKSQGCIYTVPAGYTWEVTSFSVAFSVAGQIQLRVRNNLGLVYSDNTLPIAVGCWILPAYVSKVIPEKTQVQLWCSCTSTGIVGAVFQAVLRAN